ncbi:MAG: HEAT repeat domain-containing protein [Proteobacteria bacterium]|nr:HEAT repeat domain-containing protein [Pseudomonadota bacterium]
MATIKEQLNTLFAKITAGTVTREEGGMLLGDLVGKEEAETLKELAYMVENPPESVNRKTVFHTIVLARNKAYVPLIAKTLDSQDEELAIVAAEELSRLHTAEAVQALGEHLRAETCSTRKASAAALARGCGSNGVQLLREHLLESTQALYCDTSAAALLQAGRAGIEALIEVLVCGKEAPVNSAVEALVKAPGTVLVSEVRSLIDALMLAGDNGDPVSTVALLKVIASLGGAAGKYEGFVLAFEENLSSLVSDEAGRTLAAIRT